MHKIWSKLPLELAVKGQQYGWRSIAKKAKGFLTGKWLPPKTQTNKTKQSSDRIGDSLKIDGFHAHRTNECARMPMGTRSDKVDTLLAELRGCNVLAP